MRSSPNSNSVWSSHQPSVEPGSSWATSMNMATRCGIWSAMLPSAAAVGRQKPGRRSAVQPGERTVWFTFRPERRQSLSFVQATEPGTLRAHVLAKFSRRNCQSYFPPRLSVELYPR